MFYKIDNNIGILINPENVLKNFLGRKINDKYVGDNIRNIKMHRAPALFFPAVLVLLSRPRGPPGVSPTFFWPLKLVIFSSAI